MAYDGEHPLICLFWHLYIFFGKVSVKVSDRYFNRVVFWLSFKSSFYILDNSSLSDVSFVHIFSQSVACLLILLTLSFAEQDF